MGLTEEFLVEGRGAEWLTSSFLAEALVGTSLAWIKIAASGYFVAVAEIFAVMLDLWLFISLSLSLFAVVHNFSLVKHP